MSSLAFGFVIDARRAGPRALRGAKAKRTRGSPDRSMVGTIDMPSSRGGVQR
jgi:hypothetical protein